MPGPRPLAAERDAVAAACRRLAACGLVSGTTGNVSARRGELVAVTPTGAELAELDADQVTVVGLDGAVAGGGLAPTSELDLHLGVYTRYAAGAVVHTHAPTATALSCVLDELPCIHYEMLAFGGTARVAPYATFGTPELAAGVLEALQGRSAALMSNHGTLTFGDDLDAAVRATDVLEWASGVYLRAVSVGRPRVLDEGDRDAVAAAISDRAYGTTRPAQRP